MQLVSKASKLLVCVIICVTFLAHETQEVSLEEDLTLTYPQKLALDKFREIVHPFLRDGYMKRDIYLIRWLRAKNFNIMEAALLLANNIRWREEAKMDTIINEDWSEYEERFPYYLEGCDKTGRPVASVPVSTWDIRVKVLSGERDKIIRYFDKLIEEINTIVRMAQDKGANITQYSLLFDMKNYNLVEQGCQSCLPVYLSMFTSYENHWPGMIHQMVLINTPPIFQTLLSLIRPLLSPLTRDALFIYGTNKEEWKNALLNEIDASQLSKTYGGIREQGLEPFQVKALGEWKCNANAEIKISANNTAIKKKKN